MPPEATKIEIALHGLDGVSTAHDAPSLSFRRSLDPGPEYARLEGQFASLKYVELPFCIFKRQHPRHFAIMAIPSPSTMPDLSEVLERIGLSTYLSTLYENGFRNWETVVDITEEDLTTLNFKLGHRRALQREIATWRGVPQSLSLDLDAASPEPTPISSSALETLARQQTTPPPREKRRYRRHPRADTHAPKKPKTACMLCTYPVACT